MKAFSTVSSHMHDHSQCSKRMKKNWVRYTTTKFLGIVMRHNMKVNKYVVTQHVVTNCNDKLRNATILYS